jgi:hypothetical protein
MEYKVHDGLIVWVRGVVRSGDRIATTDHVNIVRVSKISTCLS